MFKNTQQLLLTLCLIFVFAKAVLVDNPKEITQNCLFNFMLRNSNISHGNTQRNTACFDYYIPILNGITADYEAAYATCLSTADEGRSKVDTSLVAKRECMAANAEAACDLMRACGELNSSIDYFECYVQTGSQNSKTMYMLAANASDILEEAREQYHQIEYEENRCTKSAERTYVTQTSTTKDELQSCVQGLTPVPETSNTPKAQVKKINSRNTTKRKVISNERTSKRSALEVSIN